MRRSRPLIALLAVLALVIAPVAAHALGSAASDADRTVSVGMRADGQPHGVGAMVIAGSSAPGLPALPAIAAPSTSLRIPSVFPSASTTRAVARRGALAAAARADADVLVDKRRALPDGYRPRDLVRPRVAFLAGVADEGRQLRRRPARALERLFAAARRDGVRLAAVSAFRSEASQRALFAGYASERGVERAAHVSARAGHSEHQTGLAVDVAGADGRCVVEACFAGTRPARWLARHATEHGWVVRYPRGAERVTGYAYEPWHLRWVGGPLAREAAASGLTLDRLLR